MDAPDSGLSPTPVETPTMDAVPAFFFQYFCTAFLRPVYKYRFFGFAILGERIRVFLGVTLTDTFFHLLSTAAPSFSLVSMQKIVQHSIIRGWCRSENHIAFILIIIIGMINCIVLLRCTSDNPIFYARRLHECLSVCVNENLNKQ